MRDPGGAGERASRSGTLGELPQAPSGAGRGEAPGTQAGGLGEQARLAPRAGRRRRYGAWTDHPRPGVSQRWRLTRVWRRGPESNRRIELLQSSALPLGYRAATREAGRCRIPETRARPESPSPRLTVRASGCVVGVASGERVRRAPRQARRGACRCLPRPPQRSGRRGRQPSPRAWRRSRWMNR